MALKIRLRQQGRSNRQFYRIVVADVRSPRDGKYVEAIGWYNPFETQEDRLMQLNVERLQHWMGCGAQMSDNVACLVKKSAPAVIRAQTERTLVRREKTRLKRRAYRQRTAQRRAANAQVAK